MDPVTNGRDTVIHIRESTTVTFNVFIAPDITATSDKYYC